MRSYEIQITVRAPVTLSYAEGFDDPVEGKDDLFRLLNNLLTEVATDADRMVRERLGQMRQGAVAAGVRLEIPVLSEPMGTGRGITDVTGHLGNKWRLKDTV